MGPEEDQVIGVHDVSHEKAGVEFKMALSFEDEGWTVGCDDFGIAGVGHLFRFELLHAAPPSIRLWTLSCVTRTEWAE